MSENDVTNSGGKGKRKGYDCILMLFVTVFFNNIWKNNSKIFSSVDPALLFSIIYQPVFEYFKNKNFKGSKNF